MTINKKEFEKTFLSVVMSTYNDEKYIKASIDSILSQTHPYFEFIIINDGSTDRTRQIVESYDDERIVLINKENTGLIDSLNLGVKTAKYDWIARMDGDDIAEPTRFEEEVRCIKDGVAFISMQSSIIDENNNRVGHTSYPKMDFVRYLYFKFDVMLPVIHSSVIFNKKIFYEVGGYDPFMLIAEDRDLWLKMLSKGRHVLVDKPLLKYRRHSGSISIQKKSISMHNALIGFIKFRYSKSTLLTSKEYDSVSAVIKHSHICRYVINGYRNRIEYVFQVFLKNIFVLFDFELKRVFHSIK